MKNIIKGLIALFSIMLVFLAVLMIWALARESNGVPIAGGFMSWISKQRLINSQTIEMGDISEISIKNYSSDIFIKKSDSNDIVIKEYVGDRSNESSFISVNQDGKILNISENKKLSNSSFIFGSSHRYFELYLPEAYQGMMALDSSSGDVFSEMSMQFADCSINTASGDIKLTGLTADKISIKALSGDVHADKITGKKKLSTQSGYINIDNSIGDTEISTRSGDVSLDKADGHMDINTSSGYLRIENLTGSAKVESTSGDIQLNFVALNGDLELTSTSGYASCIIPKNTGFRFLANTNSGDIMTDFDSNLNFNRKGTQAEGTVGDTAEYKIEVETNSGDIKVKLR